MKTNLEIEYKTLITPTQKDALKRHFPFASPISQVNVYFDTPNQDLFKQKMMCRIRIIEGRYEFTLKVPQADGVMEYELLLNDLNMDDQNLVETLAKFNIKAQDLIETTRSETNRSMYRDTFGDWCLDETQFPHHKDIEIEYELHKANKKAYPHYRNTLESLNITPIKTDPKYIRALNSSQ